MMDSCTSPFTDSTGCGKFGSEQLPIRCKRKPLKQGEPRFSLIHRIPLMKQEGVPVRVEVGTPFFVRGISAAREISGAA
jgi:hypothetical protein